MTITTQSRPQRWDQPFGSEMTDADVERLLGVPEIQAIEADKFPSGISLKGILRNDVRIMRYKVGDIVIREGLCTDSCVSGCSVVTASLAPPSGCALGDQHISLTQRR